MTWWEFMEADSRSQAFRDYLVVSATRTTVAAKPTCASAYTIAKGVLLTLFDTARPWNSFDRVLNGPTNEVWIDPWRAYLGGWGFVSTPTRSWIRSSSTAATSGRSGSCAVTRSGRARAAYQAGGRAAGGVGGPLDGELEQLCSFWTRPRTAIGAADGQAFENDRRRGLAGPAGRLPGGRRRQGLGGKRAAALRRLSRQAVPRAMCADLRAHLRRRQQEYRHLADAATRRRWQPARAGYARRSRRPTLEVEADHYLFALPVEQMAYYVQRSETLQRLDPALKNIILLSEHVDWMAGVQFYLKDVVNITRGHIDLLDSEWALTAVSQVQFWKDVDLAQPGQRSGSRGPAAGRGGVGSILSVDVSAWDRKGRLRPKEAYNCTPARSWPRRSGASSRVR